MEYNPHAAHHLLAWPGVLFVIAALLLALALPSLASWYDRWMKRNRPTISEWYRKFVLLFLWCWFSLFLYGLFSIGFILLSGNAALVPAPVHKGRQ